MGSSYWSDDFYAAREAHRAATGASAFAYNDTLRRAAPNARKTHRKMNPLHVPIRESRDSDSHPNSKSIAVLFDVTGSMGAIPVILQKKLANLMNLLIRKRYLEHPQILFGAIGDATCDRAPLQIGQFESGIEMDDNLGRMYLEGGGGGQQTESYELAAYFIARHTSIDCFEKRGEKGYLFIIGDESCYHKIKRREVAAIIGDTLQSDIPTHDLFAELQQKFHVFFIIPTHASNGSNADIRRSWQKLLGQNVLQLDDPAAVCETIALTIGLCENQVDLDEAIDNLHDLNTSRTVTNAVSNALANLARSAAGTLRLPTPSSFRHL